MNRQKFCVLATQRSGSTWLVKLLGRHPDIRCFDEVLLYRLPENRTDPNMRRYYDFHKQHGGIRPWSLWRYMNTFFDEYPGSYQAIGYKIMYDQLIKRFEVIYSLIRQNYKVIHLVRRNYLDIIISKNNMRQRGMAHSVVDVRLDGIYLDPGKLKRDMYFLSFKLWVVRTLIAWMPLPSIEIYYQDLQVDKPQTLKKIFEFLDLSTQHLDMESDIRKISQGSYRDKIANYDEVAAALSGTPFESFLEEESLTPQS